jgi:hypothetical protein
MTTRMHRSPRALIVLALVLSAAASARGDGPLRRRRREWRGTLEARRAYGPELGGFFAAWSASAWRATTAGRPGP